MQNRHKKSVVELGTSHSVQGFKTVAQLPHFVAHNFHGSNVRRASLQMTGFYLNGAGPSKQISLTWVRVGPVLSEEWLFKFLSSSENIQISSFLPSLLHMPSSGFSSALCIILQTVPLKSF